VKEKINRELLTTQFRGMQEKLKALNVPIRKEDFLNAANHRSSKGLEQAKNKTLATYRIVFEEMTRRLQSLPNLTQTLRSAQKLVKDEPVASKIMEDVANALDQLTNAHFTVTSEDISAYITLPAESMAEILRVSVDKE
jgi:hypothetical protein